MSQDNQTVVIDVDQEQEPLEPQSDAQSEIGESIASSSTSLRESILEYRLENGRTYHKYKDGAYLLPNDERELERLGITHPTRYPSLWLLVNDNRLGMAPPCQKGAKVGRVLDVGTGTGIWALDFGDEHPESEVIAIDLSPTLPAYVPPNVKFEVDDAEDPWTYSRPFQYIHSRILSSGLSDWKKYLRKCYDNLEPGGWVELQEVDLYPTSDDETLKPESNLIRWCDLLQEASNKFGRPFFRIAPLKDVMVDVGFVDVSLTVTKWPSNAWPKDRKWKEIGIWNGENMMNGLEGFSMAALTRGHDWTRKEVNIFLIDVRKEIRDKNIHAYWPV
ncbi:secondary metabolism regulator LAE1 [Colletotrichum spaethianum]|uniref:Secondary metabolism regulator LAE1 n=1 Tax=Colletotrichum spaethianum TaxID=700344 RepID=A0AA37P4V0_9PEZI|nr:secondary metabolism regulator LAE1 [Colletotrichum spaethianum]GKT42126.1 secondary metabolism regulator LAE1 [Colletotrichum spaethianum]